LNWSTGDFVGHSEHQTLTIDRGGGRIATLVSIGMRAASRAPEAKAREAREDAIDLVPTASRSASECHPFCFRSREGPAAPVVSE
jgi:hypothetical protein